MHLKMVQMFQYVGSRRHILIGSFSIGFFTFISHFFGGVKVLVKRSNVFGGLNKHIVQNKILLGGYLFFL